MSSGSGRSRTVSFVCRACRTKHTVSSLPRSGTFYCWVKLQKTYVLPEDVSVAEIVDGQQVLIEANAPAQGLVSAPRRQKPKMRRSIPALAMRG